MLLRNAGEIPDHGPVPWYGRLIHWAEKRRFGARAALALAVASLASGVATYGALTGSQFFGSDPAPIVLLLNLNLILMLALGVVVVRRVVSVWAEHRRGSAGSHLHIRLVLMFSLVAVTPAIIVAVFSALFFNFGIQSWFNDRVRTAIGESVTVAEAYLHEHQQVIRADALAMANDLNRIGASLLFNPQRLNQHVSGQAALRSLTEATLFDENGHVLARSGYTISLEFERIPEWALDQARNGDVVVVTADNDDRVRALVRLDNLMGTYLYVGRFVDPKVIGHMLRTQGASQEYSRLEEERGGIQITFSIMFIVVALLLLLAAVWVGLILANQLARPISRLIGAAEQVRAGDLSVRVAEGPAGDELGSLSRAFNRMTSQLDHHRRELIEANRQLDERRRFTETVLAGVSAGVIGLDKGFHVTLTNRSASDFLALDLDDHIGERLDDAIPEMADLLASASKRPERLAQGEVKVPRENNTARILHVRIAAETSSSIGDLVPLDVLGYVVTFDDVTDLLAAQRTAAWADVARRIAHEIKNPLTPIQLAAERLKRKYLKEITSDPDTFVTCTDTIVRQVSDIGRMVDEFSSFARMPAPVMKAENLVELCRQALFLQRTAHTGIDYEVALPDAAARLTCDGRQISQVLTNLLKNAMEAIEGIGPSLQEAGERGRIGLRLEETSRRVEIIVEDNGKGFPSELRDRLTEPYVTTRTKGTGLGLAIVKKIMEDHGGDLILEDREGRGARVRLIFHKTDAGDGMTESLAADSAARTVAHGS